MERLISLFKHLLNTTSIFLSLKNWILPINSLASNIIVSATETSTKVASTLCKKQLTIFFLAKKLKILCSSYDTILFNSSAYGTNTY